MKFLVTGGAGFIGSHIVERLLKDGHFVRVLDNFSSGKLENLAFAIDLSTIDHRPLTPSFELVKGDIRNFETCLETCEGMDYVLHQAALRSVPKSMTMPHEYNAVNIDGMVNMLQAAREKRVKRFVYASSSSVYGEAESFPQKESDPSLLISPYALTKLTGEYYARIFSKNYGLETVGLRYFNVFGPRQALDDEYAVVIPKFIHCILNDEQPPIFGNGKQSRDFTYIDNVVEANILAATAQPANRKPHTVPLGAQANRVFCEVFNVANGKDNTVLQLVEALNKIIGKDIKPKFLPIRQGDAFRTLADVTKIKSILVFKPTINFEEGLRRTVKWFEKQYKTARMAK